MLAFNPRTHRVFDDFRALADSFFGAPVASEAYFPTATLARETWPAFRVEETDEAFVFEGDLPGLSKDEVEITFEDGVLTIAGERKEAVPEGYRAARLERSMEAFSRRYKLRTPVSPGDAKAEFADGVLKVTLPKAEQAKPMRIEVSG